jgi:predicted TIM-barrel fold metal-dependent hydrolase
MSATTSDMLISSDSHVIEDPDLWVTRLPAALRDRAPRYEDRKKKQHTEPYPGGADPSVRVKEMAVDGVSGEVLYPTVASDQFGITDPALQEACFRVYNDWLIEYCSVAPDRLYGVACISVYDPAAAARELERCKNAGLRGALIWQVPMDGYSFASDHDERFWAAAQDLAIPVSLHILTGKPFPLGGLEARSKRTPLEKLHESVNNKLGYVTDSVLDIVGSGVFDRYPELKLVLVENEISWLPFVVSQWDKYVERRGSWDVPAKELPSDYVRHNVYATFFNDPPIKWFLQDWGFDNCMWSNDFPHPNSTWPKSREVIARDLGHFAPDVRRKLVSENCARLYDLRVPALH